MQRCLLDDAAFGCMKQQDAAQTRALPLISDETGRVGM